VELFILFLFYSEIFKEFVPEEKYENIEKIVEVIRDLHRPISHEDLDTHDIKIMQYLRES
jgi:hypothetical protein